ncbi:MULTISPECIES: polysaccharide deacetylase family protein [Clostridium]|uniref:polysaccharide deacetylase family protein n=1 Tax=Clostridium TaxID=1485 RepID=UPI001FA71667|nr:MULTISPECIES: polysaccharide deacetylase family protein [Clostridium]
MKKSIRNRSIVVLIVALSIIMILALRNNYKSKTPKVPYVDKEFQKSKMIMETAEKCALVLKKHDLNRGTRVEDAFTSDGKKTAYLTFDDGPSTTVTPSVLKTLEENNINATFFLIGSNIKRSDESEQLARRIFYEGNSIGNHTYSHNPSIIYPNNSIDPVVFMQEINATDSILKNVLGQSFSTRILRMPGGRMTRVHYHDVRLFNTEQELKQQNMVDIDWNAYGFDAEGRPKTAEQIFENIKRTTYGKQKVVVLMHDTYGKEETAKALPSVIAYLKSQGYEFGTLK